MNKSQTSLKKSVFSLKMLGSCAFISYCAFTSTGYASTFEIDVPNGTSYVPSITAVAGTVTISGASQSAILEIDNAAAYDAATVTHISTATVNLHAANALGSASTNTITLTDSALQMGVAQTVANHIILAGADVIDINGNNTTVTPAITGASTSLDIKGAGTLTLSAAATHTAPTTIEAASTVKAGAVSVMADATSLAVNGTFDMNTRNQTVNNLSGTGTVQSTGGTPAALTVLPDAGSSFAGTLASTISAITVHDATHFLDLTGATNSMATGTITIGSAANQTGGLLINAAAELGTGTSLVLAGGTLKQTAATITIPQPMNVTASSKFDANNANATLTGALTGTGTTFTLANTGGTSADVITMTPSATNSSFTGSLNVTGGTLALTTYKAVGSADATSVPTCSGISMSSATKLVLTAPMTLPAVTFQVG